MRLDNNLSYAKFQGLYYCTDKNKFELVLLLLNNTRPFNFHLHSHLKLLKFSPQWVIKFLRIINIIRQIHSNNIEDVIELPYDGHILIKTTSGYKIFNLKKKLVVTHFGEDVQNNVFDRIVSNLNKLKDHPEVAPKTKMISYDMKFIVEEYINIYKANFFYPINDYFFENILPILERNIEKFPCNKVNLAHYVTKQGSIVSSCIKRLFEEGHDIAYLMEIEDYIRTISAELSSSVHYDNNIYLTLSHGDLHAWNILHKKNQSIIIDWDTIKERSLLHDFCYLFFHNIFTMENVNYTEFKRSFKKSLEITNLQNCYGNELVDLSNEKNKIDLYSKLFFIEYVVLSFENRIAISKEKKHVEKQIERLINSIEVFKEIEKV